MARSPLTLAASVSSALPRVGVVGVAALTEHAGGRFDSALADLDDGRRVVVRVPTDSAAAAELAAEARALHALTPGVRSLLPFRAPELLGEAGLGTARVVVVDHLPGYRVDPGHLPAGRGAATSLGGALAALHNLPISIVRTEGLPVRSPGQVRDDVERLVDRAEATRSLPPVLAERWRRALRSEALWRFESAVVLGGAGAASFLFEDVADAPHVTGLLEWHGLSVGDPAVDLQWLASAPAAADDVYTAYVAHSDRAPDARARERARLYAELEFAKWLIHGHETGDAGVVEDATALLASLADGVKDDDLVTDSALGVDEAIALLDRMPGAPASPSVDTSMQTDAYDPEELSQWMRDADGAEEDDDDRDAEGFAPEPATGAAPAAGFDGDDVSTAPIHLPQSGDASRKGASSPDEARPARDADSDGDAVAEAERASDAALRRWLTD